MAVPLSETHPDVLVAVRALIDAYGALGIINVITQLVDLDKRRRCDSCKGTGLVAWDGRSAQHSCVDCCGTGTRANPKVSDTE